MGKKNLRLIASTAMQQRLTQKVFLWSFCGLYCGAHHLALAEDNQYRRALPRVELTPGEVLDTPLKTICVPGYTKTVRNVPEKKKREVFTRYGVVKTPSYKYEVDHFIPLCLGGSNDIKNLWPQPYQLTWSALKKDKLEWKLCRMICSGEISVEEAREAITENWIEGYIKYVEGK